MSAEGGGGKEVCGKEGEKKKEEGEKPEKGSMRKSGGGE